MGPDLLHALHRGLLACIGWEANQGEAQKHNTVVHPCSRAYLPREAIAIMEPSGANRQML